MKTCKFTLLLAVIILFAASANASAAWNPGSHDENNQYWITEPYEYPIVPGTGEWAEFKNLSEMVNACAIPKEILDHMTTPALVQTIIDYPLLANAFMYSNTCQGLEAVSGYFPALKELAGRRDGWHTVAQMCWNYRQQNRWAKDDDYNVILTEMSYSILLHWTSRHSSF